MATVRAMANTPVPGPRPLTSSSSPRPCATSSRSRCDEGAICDAIEAALAPLRHLDVTRVGNTLVARTSLGRAERVVLAGHIDTVPLTTDPPNLPTQRRGRRRCGAAAPST